MAIYFGDENGKAKEVTAVGVPGPQGPAGPQGPQGPEGKGFPAGGTTGQVLVKKSGTDYDIEWKTIIEASTADLEAGVSPLETGKIYLVYE